jgi:hypothetical protein
MTQTWMTGEEAAEVSGKSIAEIDEAAATGVIDAEYQGWQLMVAKRESGVNEVQHIAIGGGPNGGSFTLEFDGQWTGPIVYHPSAVQITNALTALPNVGTGNIATAKVGSWDYDVTFKGALGNQDVSQLGWDDAALSGGTVTVTTTTEGSP